MEKYVFEFGIDGSVVLRLFVENEDAKSAFHVANEKAKEENEGLEFIAAYKMKKLERKNENGEKTASEGLV